MKHHGGTLSSLRRQMHTALYNFHEGITDYRLRCKLERFTDKDYRPLPPKEEVLSYADINVHINHDIDASQITPEMRRRAAEMLDKHITWHAGFSLMGNGVVTRWGDARK